MTFKGEVGPFWTRHTGPYVLRLTRPHPTLPGQWTGERLPQEHIHGQDAEHEALALLGNPEDKVAFVNVWSVSEEAFVGGYKNEQYDPSRNQGSLRSAGSATGNDSRSGSGGTGATDGPPARGRTRPPRR